MRVSVYVHEGKRVKADVCGSGDTQFIVLRIDEMDVYIKGYNQEAVDEVSKVIETLVVARNDLQNKVFEQMCEPEELDPITHQKLTRTERHQGQADNGQDTWDEHDQKV